MKPIYNIKPNTYHNAFFLAAIITSILAGLSIEIHDRNLLGLYRRPERNTTDIIYNISVTLVTTGVLAYITYWIIRIIFGYGESTLVK